MQGPHFPRQLGGVVAVSTVYLLALLSSRGLLSATSEPKSAPDSCHLRELELCLVGFASFFQNPNGIPIAEAEMKRQCEYMNESMSCLENYGQFCLTPRQSSIVGLFAGDFVATAKEFCSQGTDLRAKYMQHAACLRRVQRERQRECVSDYQVAFESIHKLNQSMKVSTACCNTNRLKECVLVYAEEQCGRDAVQLIELLLDRSVGSLVSVACRNYDPNSTDCSQILPKVGTKPHGGRNTSALSRVISSYANAQAR